MPRRYWVIVPRSRPELFDPLASAFIRRPEYMVVLDRRVRSRRFTPRETSDRRSESPVFEPFAIIPARSTL